MPIYPCEEYAEERNAKWVHGDKCLLCEAVKELQAGLKEENSFCLECEWICTHQCASRQIRGFA